MVDDSICAIDDDDDDDPYKRGLASLRLNVSNKTKHVVGPTLYKVQSRVPCELGVIKKSVLQLCFVGNFRSIEVKISYTVLRFYLTKLFLFGRFIKLKIIIILI